MRHMPLMCLLLSLAVVSLLGALAAPSSGDALAEPAPSATPSPTATPSPGPASTVSARFFTQGQRSILVIGSPRAWADGVACPGGTVPLTVGEAIGDSVPWPYPWLTSNDPPECSRLGAVVRLCAADLCAEGQWLGEDLTLDIEAPPAPTGVSVRFVSGGQPAPVTLTGWEYGVGNTECSTSSQQGGRDVTAVYRPWPLEEDLPPACIAVSATVTARFQTVEYGELKADFVWPGHDTTVTIDVRGPSAVPPTGGGVDGGGAPVAASATGLGAALVGALAISLARRRRTS